MKKIELHKPVEFDGETFTEISLDLDGLTGEDMLSVDRQYSSLSFENATTLSKELSKEYQLLTASRAAKMPVEFFYKLSARDFTRVTIRVRDFFTGMDLVAGEG